MFIRVKSTPNSPRLSVQIVENVRDGERVKQKIVRHVGIAANDDELKRLKDVAEFVKANIENEKEPYLLPPETMAELAIEGRKKKEEVPDNVKLKDVETVQDVTTGIHDIFGEVYHELGFDKVIPRPASHENALNKLFHIVMGRIAAPGSKKKTVELLESNFGISYSLDSVYRMMDLIDEECVKRINMFARDSAEKLLKEKVRVLFYDCTTLYFESFTPDELKQNGYSKDLMINQPQVLLALMATVEGLPLGYEVFPGSTFEGNTLKAMIGRLKENYDIQSLTFVADSAMLSSANLSYLESENIKYIVSYRIKNQSKEIISAIQDISSYTQMSDEKAKEIILERKRIISTYSITRAYKDVKEREQNILRMKKKLASSKDPRRLISNSGYKKYLKLKGDSEIEIDEDKIAKSAKFDGLHAVLTNDMDMNLSEVIEQYHNLWQIEACFRITKHDLKIRPIFHWTPKRIRAHIAICFMSLVCVRHVCYRIKLQHEAMSAEKIRTALITSNLRIVKHKKTSNHYAIPSNASPEAVKIYKIFGKDYSKTPFAITISK